MPVWAVRVGGLRISRVLQDGYAGGAAGRGAYGPFLSSALPQVLPFHEAAARRTSHTAIPAFEVYFNRETMTTDRVEADAAAILCGYRMSALYPWWPNGGALKS